MLTLYCSKKLSDLLPDKLEKGEKDVVSLDAWYAHVVTIHRRKVLVAICSDNRFGVVLWGVKKAQLTNLSSVVLTAIRETMADYGIRQEIIDSYAPANEPMRLMSAAGRKGSGKLNRAIRMVEYALIDADPTELRPFYVAQYMNRDIVMSEQESYYPVERMLERLQWRYHQTPIAQRAFVLEAEMDLERYTVKRTLIVPVRRTFAALHKMLQRLFCWEDYHLHEFLLHDENGDHRLYAARAYDTDLSETEEPLGSDADFRLAELLRDGSQFTYLYDFGDGWEVELRVASTLEDYDKNYPTCTAFEGDAPPEDVGGVGGYLEFLDILADPEHPEYEETVEWAGLSWKYRPTKCEDVNRRLESC